MSNTPARPCTTTALLCMNSLSWISTPSATCLSTGGSFRLWFATAWRDRSAWWLYNASSMGEAYEPRSGCPINATIEVFGDRWSLLVLRDIVFGDRRYFRELQAGSEEGIASNILADRLKRLVELGLLTREDTRAGQRARYSLTEPAIQLVPVFAQLGSCGLRTSVQTTADIDKQARTRQSSRRTCVEHAIAEHKQWRPLQRYIGRREAYAQTHLAIAGLVSDRAARR